MLVDRSTANDRCAEGIARGGDLLRGARVAIVGKLGGVSRRQAGQLVRHHGGQIVEVTDPSVSLIVVGAEESPSTRDDLLPQGIGNRAESGEIEILQETELWQRFGLVEAEHEVKRLYTPAMLAQLLGVSVSVIRCWHRRGLLIPTRTAFRLPYFDFTEVATARRLAELVAAGASSAKIERRLDQLTEILPNVQRPLAQLSILIEGQQILLRRGEGLVEPRGQLRIDFDALQGPETGPSQVVLPAPHVLSMAMLQDEAGRSSAAERSGEPTDALLELAYEAEDAGDLELAVDYYHAMLARDGARADLSFQLGELLYRLGQVEAARERYYVALELDETFVEARASLGSVLAELGRIDLAVAAYRGALALHHEYPDVHYNLARLLDEVGKPEEAAEHWKEFLWLSPDSPWADEARARLESR